MGFADPAQNVSDAAKPSTQSTDTGVEKSGAFASLLLARKWALQRTFAVLTAAATIVSWAFYNYGWPATESIWTEMLRPRVTGGLVRLLEQSPAMHRFVADEIEGYLEGKEKFDVKASDFAKRLRTLAHDTDIQAMSDSLFRGVDSVHTVAQEYILDQVKDDSKKTLTVKPREAKPIVMYFYADPLQHCVWANLTAAGTPIQVDNRREPFRFEFSVNNQRFKDAGVRVFNGGITKYVNLKQGSGGLGGLTDEVKNYALSAPSNIQKIEIVPVFPISVAVPISGPSENFPPAQAIAWNINGYVMVTRRPKSQDCQKNPVVASADADD